MDGLILAAGKNRPGENDSTGAFQLAANQFRAINRVSSSPVFFDNSGEEKGQYAAVRQRVLKAVREGGSGAAWDTVAIFCHGGSNALWSAGLIGDDGARALADEIRPRAAAYRHRHHPLRLQRRIPGRIRVDARRQARGFERRRLRTHLRTAHLCQPGHDQISRGELGGPQDISCVEELECRYPRPIERPLGAASRS